MGAERIDVLAVMDSSVGTIEGLAEALLSVKVWEAVEPALAAATRLHNVRHAVAELIETLAMVDRIWSGDQTANIDPESPLAKVRGALTKVGAR